MTLNLETQPWAVQLTAWDVLEDLQDRFPYVHVTWWDFMPAFYERCEDN